MGQFFVCFCSSVPVARTQHPYGRRKCLHVLRFVHVCFACTYVPRLTGMRSESQRLFDGEGTEDFGKIDKGSKKLLGPSVTIVIV